jgi:hypothetical protein
MTPTEQETEAAMAPPSATPDIREVMIETMADWFRDNFEDPAEDTPHDSAEGGYQWIWGGPFDAEEELNEVFGGQLTALLGPDKADELIGFTAKQIEDEDSVIEWAPASNRIKF